MKTIATIETLRASVLEKSAEIVSLKEVLSGLVKEKADKEKEIDSFEIDGDMFEDDFDVMLNETHGEFLGKSASYIMKTLDPIMYKKEFSYYLDSLDKNCDVDYQELQEELQDIEDKIEDLESQIEDLESEIEEISEQITDLVEEIEK